MHVIISYVAFIAAGFFGVGMLIVGGIAEIRGTYLSIPVGVGASMATGLVVAIVAYRAMGWMTLIAVPSITILTILAAQIGFIPGSIANFIDDAAERAIPNQKTVEAHMTEEERNCEKDQYCKFAPITEESLAIFRRDALINGNCDRAYDCRPNVDRATVTGALISVQLRKEFPEIRGAYLHAVNLNRQSLSVKVDGPMDDPEAKALLKRICASVKKQKHPAVDLQDASLSYPYTEFGLRDFKMILSRKC